MTNRTVISISGPDRVTFLQGLVTNDVDREAGTIVYAALLTPQGKYLADFFVIVQADHFLVDVDSALAQLLIQRLSMYRLRADVLITPTDLVVSRGSGTAPEGALPDPRHAALGWRYYGNAYLNDDTDWMALRVQHVIPETGIELTPDSYILEHGFEKLNGVDFKKGCYVGQEIVARMKHKTALKKGLAQVQITGSAKPGDAITSDGNPAGTLHSVSGDKGLAYLRFDRATGIMEAGSAQIRRS